MSDILRLIAGGLLALISCYIGLLVKRRYKSREAFYTRSVAFIKYLKSEMTLKKTPIPDVVDNFTSGQKGDFDRMLKECIDEIKAGNDYQTIYDKVGISALKAEEKKEIVSFLCALGKSTLDDQLSLINAYNLTFEQRRDKCAKDSKQLGSMYFKLCVLLGLAIILILA